LKNAISVEQLSHELQNSSRSALSKAITLVESSNEEHRKLAQNLIDTILPYSGKSIRIGITGVPGVGKSTFIEKLGLLAIKNGKKVAVLAIDPSSNVNKGSILGDKTRMEELAKEENAFIRPTPSSGFLGGIASSTYQSILLCETAGYDFILIETVGVGQSEVMVNDLCDVFLFLTVSNTGDELQGIKRGIMEMADIIFINKSDDLTKNNRDIIDSKTDLIRAIQLLPQKYSFWKTPVISGSALNNINIEELYYTILKFIEKLNDNSLFSQNRKHKTEKRFESLLQYLILEKIQSLQHKNKEYQYLFQQISEGEISEFRACEHLLNKLKI